MRERAESCIVELTHGYPSCPVPVHDVAKTGCKFLVQHGRLIAESLCSHWDEPTHKQNGLLGFGMTPGDEHNGHVCPGAAFKD
jgi:hypothetical protein